MNVKNLLLSTLAGGVVDFLLSFLFYAVLFDGFFEAQKGTASNVDKEPMLFGGLILASLVFAFLLAFIFERWANISTFMGGLKGGAIVSFLVCSTFNLIFYSTANLSTLTGTIVDTIIFTVVGALVGGVVATVLGMGKKE